MTERILTDAVVLDHITSLLSEPEWNGADLLEEINSLVALTGRITAAADMTDDQT